MGEQEVNRHYFSEPLKNYKNHWKLGLTFLGFALIFVAILPTFTDPDLWGHVRFGIDTLGERSIIRTDPYSYLTDELTWINHEWLAEVLMAGAWLNAHNVGLVSLKIFLFGLTVVSVYLYVNSQYHPALIPALAILVLASSGVLLFSLVVRPQLFTFLLFAITLMVIHQAEMGQYRWLWAMPLVIALWTNLHGGVLAGLGILVIWGTLHLILNRGQWRKVLPPLSVSGAALLINPYGATLVFFLLETATVPRPEIMDWQPVEIGSPFGAVYLVILFAGIAAIAMSTRKRNWTLLILFGVTALLPLSAVRHLPLMAIAFAILVGDHMASWWENRFGHLLLQIHLRSKYAFLPFVLATILVIVGLISFPGRVIVNNHIQYPSSAITLLTQAGFQGDLATIFDWGEYIIWHAGPEVQVSIDGRRETVYSPAIYQQNFDLWRGHNDWSVLLREHPTDAALFDRGSAADNLLRLSPEWRLIYEDDNSVLFISTQFEGLEEIQRAAADFTPPEPPRYFP